MTDLEETPENPQPRVVPVDPQARVTGTHVVSEDGNYIIISIHEYRALHATTIAELWADRDSAVDALREICRMHANHGNASVFVRQAILAGVKALGTIDARYPKRKKR